MTWHPHTGGDDPLFDREEPERVRRCRVKFRNGKESDITLPSKKWRWKWGKPFPPDSDWDIVAYEDVP